MFEDLIREIKQVQGFSDAGVSLHAPVFSGNERKYVLDAIDSTFVSSVGEYVNRFEKALQDITGVKRAIACVNGTAALEIALRAAGFQPNDLALTQSFSFIATANAIHHAGGDPVFLDIDKETLGLSPEAMRSFLEKYCIRKNGACLLRDSGRRIGACVPMHTFGMPCRIVEIASLCQEWNIPLVEDAAESLGSEYEIGKHCGCVGLVSALSFNGNKIVTTGGGGAVLTNNEELGSRIKHLTTTAKIPHQWEFRHDAVAWNFRMPNINAALGCAQLELLDDFLVIKRQRATKYAELFADKHWRFVSEPEGVRSNYWLCAVLTGNREERNAFLAESNASGLMTRPAWEPLHTMPFYADCQRDSLSATLDIAERLVNLPSGI